MAHIVMFVGGISPAKSGDDIVYQSYARLSTMDQTDETIVFFAQVSPSALASTVNDTIKDAGIAAASAAGYAVGALDKKTLLAGAVGL